jgi:FkbM family methyltransferase
LIADVLNWRADVIYQVGIGNEFQEVDVLKSEWPGVLFIGCEPCPSLIAGLRKSYPGDLYAVAISNVIGTRSFYTRRRHANGSSLYAQDNSDECVVPVETLDHLFGKPKGDHVLLWLDCEGSELDALDGAVQFMAGVEVVNVEMTANPVNPDWCSPLEVHNSLTFSGFVRQWIHTQRITSGQYDAIYVRPHLFKPEYCCDPVPRS